MDDIAESYAIALDPKRYYDEKFGKDCKLGEKGTTVDEMVGWHHRVNGHEFE